MASWHRVRFAFSWIVLAIVGYLSFAPAAGQEPGAPQIPVGPQLIPRSQGDREANYLAEHHFILNLRVLDGTGKPATGLGLSDFALLDNGQEKQITALREARGVGAPVPPRVMLLLDGWNDTSRDLRAVRDGIEQFLRGGEGPTELPISLALMTESGITIDDPTQDRNRLRSELASLMRLAHPSVCEAGVGYSMGMGQGSGNRSGYLNCLNLHFTLSVPMLARVPDQQVDIPGRLILVWFGPGWPHLSEQRFAEDAPALKGDFFDYLMKLSDGLREGQVTLDAVQIGGPMRELNPQRDRDLQGTDKVTSEKQATAASLSLQALAFESGGMVLDGQGELATKIAACVADAESYYVLEFDSAIAKSPGEYHSIEVKVNKPGLTTRTTKYYYATP